MAASISLINAYQQTVYHVLIEPPVTLKVGDASDVIFKYLEQHGFELVGETGIAVVTADNPMSIQRTADCNASARLQLETDIATIRPLACFPTEHCDPSGIWPAELGVMIVGCDRQWASALAEAYGQNAFLWLSREQDSKTMSYQCRAVELLFTPLFAQE